MPSVCYLQIITDCCVSIGLQILGDAVAQNNNLSKLTLRYEYPKLQNCVFANFTYIALVRDACLVIDDMAHLFFNSDREFQHPVQELCGRVPFVHLQLVDRGLDAQDCELMSRFLAVNNVTESLDLGENGFGSAGVRYCPHECVLCRGEMLLGAHH